MDMKKFFSTMGLSTFIALSALSTSSLAEDEEPLVMRKNPEQRVVNDHGVMNKHKVEKKTAMQQPANQVRKQPMSGLNGNQNK